MKRPRSPLANPTFAAAAHEVGPDRRGHAAIDPFSLEELVIGISARMVKSSAEELDAEITRSLEEILVACRVDRCGLLAVQGNNAKTVISHAWQNADVPQLPPGSELAALYPWSVRRLLVDREVVAMGKIDDLPPAANVDRQSHLQRETKSSLTIPLVVGQKVNYIFGFGAVKEARTWDMDFIRRMRLLGEIFVSALQRRETELQLKQQLGEIERLRRQLEEENAYLRNEMHLKTKRPDLSGFSSMQEVLAKVEQVAVTGSTVLIQGETGTGKELIAEAIHRQSERRQRVMVKVNCAALPAALVESELFGREKGAFTGALSRQIGRFELADGSTLFLDEIAEIPLETQAKLLRVLQAGEFERLGSPKTIKVDARVIVATNRDLAAEVEQGRFRRDLYYRLNVFPIDLPPLRARREDIPHLVWAFVGEFGERMGKKIRKVAVKDMEALTAYSWPGNVRELRNVIEHAMIVSKGDILELERRVPSERQATAALSLEEVERRHIQATLETTRGRIKGVGGAAQRLGLNPSTLYSRMRKLGIHSSRS